MGRRDEFSARPRVACAFFLKTGIIGQRRVCRTNPEDLRYQMGDNGFNSTGWIWYFALEMLGKHFLAYTVDHRLRQWRRFLARAEKPQLLGLRRGGCNKNRGLRS